MLISQAKSGVERYSPENGVWKLTQVTASGGVLELPTIDCRIPVIEIYDKVDFSDAEE